MFTESRGMRKILTSWFKMLRAQDKISNFSCSVRNYLFTFISGFDDRLVTWSNELKLYRVRCILSDLRKERNEVLENELFNRSSVVKDYIAELE